MPERFKVVCIPCKCSALPLPFYRVTFNIRVTIILFYTESTTQIRVNGSVNLSDYRLRKDPILMQASAYIAVVIIGTTATFLV